MAEVAEIDADEGTSATVEEPEGVKKEQDFCLESILHSARICSK